MKTIRSVLCVAIAALLMGALPATAQAQDKSRSEGFFVGGAYEGNRITFQHVEGAESGSGFDVTLGYGLTPNFALYGQWSDASIESESGKYTFRHFDIGTRVHFRAPAKTVVPCIQLGLTSRALHQEVGPYELEQSGFGLDIGGGINAHFSPAIAFTAGVSWSIGSLDDLKIDGDTVDEDAHRVTTARVHVGITWFVHSK